MTILYIFRIAFEGLMPLNKRSFTRYPRVSAVLGLLLLCSVCADGAEGESAAPSAADLKKAIHRGLDFLVTSQNSNGWWSTADQPAVTALVLTAFNGDPGERFSRERRSSELNRAYDFILNSAKPDGSIHRGGLINYNTALSLMALSTADNHRFIEVIKAARGYLAKTQIDFGEARKIDTQYDGGVGYGGKYQHSDMNNTLTAIEAMRWSEQVLKLADDKVRSGADPDLNWAAAARFLQSCQNLPSHNQQAWVSDNPKDRGGFVYYPGNSMAGGVTNSTTGKVALRSYGSISYAGLLSYIYAKVDRDDPRVKAVLEWLTKNYTLEENPGMGPQGYYYYLHLLTKALRAAQVETLRLADGREVRWRDEVARRLLTLQQPDGSWVNQEKRWWESDKNLVTAYVVISLEMLHGDATAK